MAVGILPNQQLARQIQADVEKQLQEQNIGLKKVYESMTPEQKKEAERFAREFMGR